MEAVLLDVHKHGQGNTGCQVTSEPDHSRLRSPLEYTTAGEPRRHCDRDYSVDRTEE